ncbi:hypothetical protein EV702DRAFT_1108700, partial [Suillus placidus]
MTSSPMPDISPLPLNPQSQRLNDNYDYDNRQQYQFSANQQLSGQLNPLGDETRLCWSSHHKSFSLQNIQWLDNSMIIPENRPLSPHNNSDFSSSGSSPPLGHLHTSALAPLTPNQNADDEVIPNTIVVKNIPVNVKRETLLDIIASLSIPTPYAFNYHLDQQGSFRAADTDAVMAALNGFDVQGHKLHVEYKKVLQAGEKEFHQAYNDFGPVTAPAFTPQRSFSSGAYQQQQYSPPPLPHLPISQSFNPTTSPPIAPTTPNPSEKSPSSNELDLNDPSTLEIYSRILLFKDDRMRDELAFSNMLSPKQRRVVDLIAQKLGVYHYSVGEGDERYAVVTRIDHNRVGTSLDAKPFIQRAQAATMSRAPSAYLSSSQSQPASSLCMKNNFRSSAIPPVHSLPSSVTGMSIDGGNFNDSSVRQPRGPGVGCFGLRRGTNSDQA